MIIDTHAHYDSERFDDDRHELLAALPASGVEKIINIGCDIETSEAAIALAAEYPHVYASVGFHPHYVKKLTEENLQRIIALAGSEKVVGFGEIGLDFFHDHSPRDVQRFWFARLLDVVADLNLPAIIHSRDASDEVFVAIEKSRVRRGVVHAFSGDDALARAYVEMGFYIGIGGVVTFKKTDALQAAVAAVPLEKILLETDCPYLAPEPFRGKRNESPLLVHVAEKIAQIKGATAEAVCAQTSENAKKLFNL
ncbi:MAG: TatD family hydrolase [Defluviitaleaceae bacterium]|nr:TatD family hydrolase [Defluviitaleaceae bacterium]